MLSDLRLSGQCLLVRVPLHDGLEESGEEPAVPPSLVLGAAVDGVGDVTEDSVETDQSREIRSLQHVDHVDKLGSVNSITRGGKT